MPYTFRYRQCAEALYDALAEDAYYITMQESVADADQGREAMLRYYDYAMQEACTYGILQMPETPHMGASIWSTPVSGERSEQRDIEKKRFLMSAMGPGSLDKYLQISAAMSRMSSRFVPPGSWYLSILGVAPRFQNQGVGVGLTRPILERADRSGRPVYLETFTPRNIAFYQRLGFDVRGDVDEPITGSRYWVMVREPT